MSQIFIILSILPPAGHWIPSEALLQGAAPRTSTLRCVWVSLPALGRLGSRDDVPSIQDRTITIAELVRGELAYMGRTFLAP